MRKLVDGELDSYRIKKQVMIPIVFFETPVIFEDIVLEMTKKLIIKSKNKKTRKNATLRKCNKRWKELRTYLLKTKEYSCEKCGCYAIYAHHIKPVSEYPELQFEISNILILCLECHRQQHPDLPNKMFTKKGL